MRVTVQIDDQSVSVDTTNPEQRTAPATGPEAVPADLAARAEALGAISAGPAPVQAPGGTEPGAPGITVATAQTDPAPTEVDDAIAAGAAPDQPEQMVTVDAAGGEPA
jgi:hypothetical protein